MTLSERLAEIENRSRSARSTVSQAALLILGKVAQEHFIAVVVALEEHYAGHGELRALEETLAGLKTEAQPNRESAHSET